MAYQQAQAEGLCLRYPENFGQHAEMKYETAVNMLLRAVQLSTQVPYAWSFIDKPPEGQVYLLYMQSGSPFPNDGIRYQDQETRVAIPVGNNRELEVLEIKYGFIPGPGSPDTSAWRLRRRYRLHKGGYPQLVLVHYSRGPSAQIVPTLANHPIRNYPLRQVTEPSVYVLGDKMGQKVYPQAPPGGGLPPGAHPPGPHAGFGPQAMVAQQNGAMEALERRRERERGRDRGGSVGGRPPARVEDEDSGDELDHLSTRTLAMARYRRNFALVDEVFYRAAFGPKASESTPRSYYSIFDKSTIENKIVKLQEEVSALTAAAEERKAARANADQQAISDGSQGLSAVPA